MANDGRLSKYGEWSLIDSICQTYNYTHEQVFKLSWSEAMTMIAYNREKAYVNHTTDEMYKSANSNK